MVAYSTNEAARKVGISPAALSNYIRTKKVPAPETAPVGRVKLHVWSESDIERLRKLLPKIANGRKTRYQKTKTQPGAAALRKTRNKRTITIKKTQRLKPEPFKALTARLRSAFFASLRPAAQVVP